MDKEWQPLELIKTTAKFLAEKNIPTPRLDAEVLLCEVLDCSRIKLYSSFDRALSESELNTYREMIRRRSKREPVSRILGKREFMGLEFIVTPAVLSPRPETEILVEQALKILDPAPKKKKSDAVFEAMDKKMREFITEQRSNMPEDMIPSELAEMIEAQEVKDIDAQNTETAKCAEAGGVKTIRRVLDLGTGTGCIPISIKIMARDIEAVGVDISPEALAVANRNAEELGADIEWREGNFFSACTPGEKFDIITSNPPYVIEGDKDIWPEVSMYDPALALYADNKGLACYEQIIPQAKNFLNPEGYLLLEIGIHQDKAVKDIILAASPLAEIETVADHAGIPRVIVATGL